MNIESMRIRSYRSFKVDEHVPAVAAERYRTLKAYDRLRSAGCSEGGALGQLGIRPAHAVSVAGRAGRRRPARPGAEVDASAPGPAPVVDAERRQGGDGPAPEVPLHGQGAPPGDPRAQGPAPERVHGRPHHRARAGGRRDPPRVVLRGAHQAQAAAPLREVGEALEVRRQGPPGRRTGAGRPHDLHLRPDRRSRSSAPSVRSPSSWSRASTRGPPPATPDAS